MCLQRRSNWVDDEDRNKNFKRDCNNNQQEKGKGVGGGGRRTIKEVGIVG
jgi:hypothetical protein